MPFVSRHLKISIRKQNRRAGTINNAEGTPSAFIFYFFLISPQLVY